MMRKCGWILALCLVGAGCSSGSMATRGRPFPADVPRPRTLDIQVLREGTRIRATNTTDRKFGPSTLWVNMRFSRSLDGWDPGQTVTLSLKEFRDEFGDPFNAGGFFSREQADPIVLLQLETPGADGKPEMLGLVSVAGKGE